MYAAKDRYSAVRPGARAIVRSRIAFFRVIQSAALSRDVRAAWGSVSCRGWLCVVGRLAPVGASVTIITVSARRAASAVTPLRLASRRRAAIDLTAAGVLDVATMICPAQVVGAVSLWGVRRCETTSAPPMPIIESAKPPAAPMPASLQSKPSLRDLIRTIVGGALTDPPVLICFSWLGRPAGP